MARGDWRKYDARRDPVKRRAQLRKAMRKRRQRPEVKEYDRAAARKYLHAKKGLPVPTRPEPRECECCGRTSKRHLALDHCHETGVFRGWLCFDCNTGVGKLGDNEQGLLRALKYLRRTA